MNTALLRCQTKTLAKSSVRKNLTDMICIWQYLAGRTLQSMPRSLDFILREWKSSEEI